MWRLIINYSLNWRAAQDSGIIWLQFDNGDFGNIQPNSAIELAALGDILRNEKPVFFETETGDLSSGWEPTGEGE
jgi:hypothetical protein